ncbi:MAG TPA: CbiX/SirB N-terminal domain-containing protein, partial [Caldilineaceae bacterium]|nr:CbiX/SirB N-terminal domain-containing protein [Caldilineaceae bacterium]
MSEKRTAAIVVGHGSIHSDSGKSMIRIAARLREQRIAHIVEAGFLNYNAPTLADAVQKGFGQGATHFLIQPYFLIDGQYASQDLPALVHTVAATVPTGTFTVGETLGYHAGLVK